MTDNYIQFLDYSVYTSASRINAVAKFVTVVDNGGRIPPDVAFVSDIMLQREQRTFGNAMAQLQLADADINARYLAKRPSGATVLPSDVSVLYPFYAHNDLLQAAPIVEHSWLWTDMPASECIWARTDLTTEERRILRNLGFERAYQMMQSGDKPYVPNDALIEASKIKREEIYGSGDGKFINPAWLAEATATVWQVGKLVLISCGIAAAATALLTVVPKAIYNFFNKDEIATNRAVAEKALQDSRIVMQQAEDLGVALRECSHRVSLGLTTQDECNRLAGLVASLKPPATPSLGGCGLWQCWPWALGTVALTAYFGHKYAQKKGWFEK